MTLHARKTLPNEVDPNGVCANTPGAKLDAGKSPVLRGVLRYFPRAIAAVADISAFGAEKYTWGGWESVPDGIIRYGDALARHILQDGDDPQSEMSHAAHAAWNALARLELMLRQDERDRSWDDAAIADVSCAGAIGHALELADEVQG